MSSTTNLGTADPGATKLSCPSLNSVRAELFSRLAANCCSLASNASGSIRLAERSGFASVGTSGSNLGFMKERSGPAEPPAAERLQCGGLVPQEKSQSPKVNCRKPGCFATRAEPCYRHLTPAWISSLGVSSACDDIPHSIPYHGGVGLSSATRSSIVTSQLLFASGQPRAQSSLPSAPSLGERAGRHHQCPAAGKGWRRVQTARAGGDPLRHLHTPCRFSGLQLRHRRGDRGRTRRARRRAQRRARRGYACHIQRPG